MLNQGTTPRPHDWHELEPLMAISRSLWCSFSAVVKEDTEGNKAGKVELAFDWVQKYNTPESAVSFGPRPRAQDLRQLPSPEYVNEFDKFFGPREATPRTTRRQAL